MSEQISEKPFAEKKKINIRGHQMAYIDEGKGTPIIFQHGNPASSYLWRNIMPYLKGKGRLIAPDLMGMGDSEKLDPSLGKNRYSYSEQYNYFTELINTLCPNEKVILVLHDAGSLVGFNWANKHRDLVIGIAYMESIVAPLEMNDFPKFMQIDLPPDGLEGTLKDPPFLVEKLLLTKREFTEFEKSVYRAPFKNVGEDCRPVISFDIPVNGYPEYTTKISADYSEWMSTNELPKLLIKGDPGYLIRNRTYEICKKWKNQTEVNVKGRHFIQEICPKEIGEAIAKFVDKILNK